MRSSCEEIIDAHIAYLQGNLACRSSDDRVWMMSPYTNIDGDSVEISVRPQDDGTMAVSDVGESLRRLANFGYDPRETANGRYLISQIIKQYRVTLDTSGIVYRLTDYSQLGEATHDVIAASLALGNLIFLARAVRPASIHEEVATFLDSLNVDYIQNERLAGRTGKKYTVDFVLYPNGKRALLKTIASSSASGVTGATNAAFRAWWDIENGWKATIIDDRVWPWRDDDIAVLRNFGHVYRWSDQTEDLQAAIQQLGYQSAGERVG